MAEEKAYTAGSLGSLTVADMGKPAAKTTTSNSQNPISNTGSAFSLGLTAAEAFGAPNLDIINRVANVDEVTLSSKYYPSSQPFLVQFLIQFPTTTTERSATGQQLASAGAIVSQGTGISFSNTQEGILEVRPNNLISFSSQEITQGIGNFSLTLFDPKWNEIENKLIKAKGRVRIRWGYADQGDMIGLANKNTTATPWLDAFVTSYALKFGLEGTTISLIGTFVGYQLNFTKTYNAYGTKGELISTIVEDIATKNGLKPVVEPTKPIMTSDDFEGSNNVSKFWVQKGETALSFIMNDLIRYARSAETDSADYHFFIKRPLIAGAQAELHFHTPYYAPNDPNNKASSIVIPTFTLYKDPNSPVVDYSPLFNATTANIMGADDTFSVIIDGTSKSVTPLTTNREVVPQVYDNKSGCLVFKVPDFNKENNKVTSFEIMQLPDLNVDEQKAILYNKLSKAAIRVIEAKLTILGTTAFQLLDKIAVIVYVPQSSSKIHWTSGFFRIREITHSIEAGSYKTTFQLITDGRSNENLTLMPTASKGK